MTTVSPHATRRSRPGRPPASEQRLRRSTNGRSSCTARGLPSSRPGPIRADRSCAAARAGRQLTDLGHGDAAARLARARHRTGPARARPLGQTAEGDYSLGAYAAGLRGILVALDVPRATVVGHSFSGGVAMQFVHQFPELTERLVLVASGGLGPGVSLALRAATLPGATLALRIASAVTPRWLARLSRRLVGAVPALSRAEIDGLADAFGSSPTTERAARSCGPSPAIASRARAAGARRPRPHRGHQDGPARLGATRSAPRYAVIPHEGHASSLDDPDAFTTVLEALLDEVMPADPASSPDSLGRTRRRSRTNGATSRQLPQRQRRRDGSDRHRMSRAVDDTGPG